MKGLAETFWAFCILGQKVDRIWGVFFLDIGRQGHSMRGCAWDDLCACHL